MGKCSGEVGLNLGRESWIVNLGGNPTEGVAASVPGNDHISGLPLDRDHHSDSNNHNLTTLTATITISLKAL